MTNSFYNTLFNYVMHLYWSDVVMNQSMEILKLCFKVGHFINNAVEIFIINNNKNPGVDWVPSIVWKRQNDKFETPHMYKFQ